MPELNEAKLNHLQAPVNSRPQGKLSQDGNSSIRIWLCTLKSSCIRREADSQSPLFAQQLPSALLSRLELHITEAVVAAFGYMCGKCYSASDTEVMSHQAWPILCSWLPQMYSHLQPSPPWWAVTRTWLRLEAQFWASSAWALSVSCLSVLLSTVTLPSPICLMNRRNYTTTGKQKKNDNKKAFTMTDLGWVYTIKYFPAQQLLPRLSQ